MIDPFAVWSPGAVLSAIIGGLLLGFLLIARFDNPRFNATESIGIVFLLLGVAKFVFWVPQFVDTYVTDGPPLAWRVVSRFLLALLFTAALALGTGAGVRRARGSWKL